MGQVKQPIAAYVRKHGVDYGPPPSVGDAAASTATATSDAPSEAEHTPAPESAPEVGP